METKSCSWCKSPLPKGRSKYCSDGCSYEYFVHFIEPFWWQNAVKIALERAENKCVVCGSGNTLEVHHIIPLGKLEPRWKNAKNDQSNLKVLCRVCHEKEHHNYGIPKEQLVLF